MSGALTVYRQMPQMQGAMLEGVLSEVYFCRAKLVRVSFTNHTALGKRRAASREYFHAQKKLDERRQGKSEGPCLGL